MVSNCTAPAPARPKGKKYHGRGRALGHVPRPPNAFILFRSDFLRNSDIPPDEESKQQTLSRLAGICWRDMSPEEQKPWHDKARKVKHDHKLQYPQFQYRPTPRGPIKRRRQSRTTEQQLQKCSELRCKYIHDKSGSSSKTRAKPCPPPRSERDTATHQGDIHLRSLPQEPVFMEPLVRDPSPPHSTYAPWDTQCSQAVVGDSSLPLSAIAHIQGRCNRQPQSEFPQKVNLTLHSETSVVHRRVRQLLISLGHISSGHKLYSSPRAKILLHTQVHLRTKRRCSTSLLQ
ncbi:hypothetical protein JB92DRAFT_1333221 [Gautieria morchelliformis]|nr:hypothetical protein JB92DRAFT_1333221 [Gautieria morchelliformis]